MKTEALDPFGIEPSGDGQELSHPRHVPVKGGIEARHLWQSRMALMEHLHKLNAGGHVLGVVGADPVQLFHQSRGNTLGLAEFQSAVDDAMADPGHSGEPDMTFQPGDQKLPYGAVMGSGNDPGSGFEGAVPDGQRWLRQADAFYLAGEHPRGERVRAVESELNARRPAVDRQNDASRLRRQLASGCFDF